MNKQEQLNKFITELAEFIEKYYSSSISGIYFRVDGSGVIQTFTGPNNSSFEISTEDEEITICFSDTHWHIDDYNNALSYENIYENTINNTIDILKGELIAVSFWNDKHCRGGSSMYANEIPKIKNFSRDIIGSFDEYRIKKWGYDIEIFIRKDATIIDKIKRFGIQFKNKVFK